MEGMSMDLEQTTDRNVTEELPRRKSDGLVSIPVAPGASGEGLPYAPKDWPSRGDTWSWKVGKRISNSGYYRDRFLIPPARYDKNKVHGKKRRMSSRQMVESFVRKEFPDADLHAFFSSFLWRIPSPMLSNYNDEESETLPNLYTRQYWGRFECKRKPKEGECKAGNKMCCTQYQSKSDTLLVMDCDICCAEDGFCRDCCCILCCGTIDLDSGGYSFIRCSQLVDEDRICGHVSHIDCALHAYLAGTVGGSIGLDVEYYCRRCDKKTSLIPHLTNMLHACESSNSQDDAEKILNMCLRLLCGSEQTGAKELLTYIESVMPKLRDNVNIGEVLRYQDIMQIVESGSSHFGSDSMLLGTINGEYHQGKSFDIRSKSEISHGKEMIDGKGPSSLYITTDHDHATMKIENDIDQALVELKKSQEFEFKFAEEKLYAQKYFLINLYQQLDRERKQLANPIIPCKDDSDSLLSSVLSTVDQIKCEEAKLRRMIQVSKGFGQTPTHILKEDFGLKLLEE